MDDKAHVRDELDLSAAEWHRTTTGGTDEPGLERAFITHTDGVTYVALRQTDQPERTVLVFTPEEWEAFVAGARDDEFTVSP